MSSIKVIMRTDNFASDEIFVGMYGRLNDQGQFEFDPSLMGLDVAKLTQISIKKGRQTFPSDQLHTVDVPDQETARALKGVLLSVCRDRWNARYDDLISRQSAGVASTLQSAKEVDEMTSDTSLELLGMKEAGSPMQKKVVDVSFKYLNARTTASEDDNGEMNGAVAVSTQAIQAISSIESVSPVEEGEQMLQGQAVVRTDASKNFFSGSASVRMNLPAVVTLDPQLLKCVTVLLMKMPPHLLGRLNLVADCKMTEEPSFSINPVMPVVAIPAHAPQIALAAPDTREDAEQTAAAFLLGTDADNLQDPDDEDSSQDAPGVA